MKKNALKVGVALSVLCVMMMGMVSCAKDESLQLYTVLCRISGSSTTINEQTTDEIKQLTDYLKSKGYSTKGFEFTYNGSVSDTDILATKRFDDYLLNVSREEIAALKLGSTANIIFILSRAHEVDPVHIAVWESKKK